MRRFGPRDVVLYVLLGLMIFFTFSTLQHMDQNDTPTYSQIRTLFLRERVEYFTLEGKTPPCPSGTRTEGSLSGSPIRWPTPLCSRRT